jgi:hypothetical protein
MTEISTTATAEDVIYAKEGRTTFEVVRKFAGTQTVLELLKKAIKRDVEALVFDRDNP